MTESPTPSRDEDFDAPPHGRIDAETRTAPESWREALGRGEADVEVGDLVESAEVMAGIDVALTRLAARDEASRR